MLEVLCLSFVLAAGQAATVQNQRADDEKKEETSKSDEKGHFLKLVEGSCLGSVLEQNKITVGGWVEASYTASTAHTSNYPLVWNDRANNFLLQQAWLRISKALDTDSKSPSYGFQIDAMFGTDYRWMLPRGLWNSQLLNSRGTQNLYGFDVPQTFLSAYQPGIFEGTEFRVGRFFCPFGYESNEGPSTPLLSRSYTFNWCPFTHWGALAIANLSKQVQVTAGAINGNDVLIGDPSEEWRFVGKFAWAAADKKTSLALSTSFGRGKFNAGDAFAPATIATVFEPAGRNNINVFDLTWTQALSNNLDYTLELMYGYQYGVPANVPGGLIDTSKFSGQTGFAQQGSIVQYLTHKFSDQLSGIARFEMFDDRQGQRTGFEGVYYATTLGLQFKPVTSILIRPEVRWDYNGSSRPFEGKHQIFTVATDLIFKF